MGHMDWPMTANSERRIASTPEADADSTGSYLRRPGAKAAVSSNQVMLRDGR